MKEQVLNILEEICGTDEVKQDGNINLFDEGLLDSLGIIELLIRLEEELKIKIDPTEIVRKEIETPDKLIKYIMSEK